MRWKNSLFITLNALLVGFWLLYALRQLLVSVNSQHRISDLSRTLESSTRFIFNEGAKYGMNPDGSRSASTAFFIERGEEPSEFLNNQIFQLNQTVFSIIQQATDNPFILPLAAFTVSFLTLQMLYTVYKHFVLQDKNLTFQYDVDDNYFEITDIISGLKDKFGEDKVDTLIDNAMRHNANSEKDVKAFNHYLIQSPITRELMTNPCNLMIDNKISRHNFDFHSLASWFESNPQQSPDGFLPIQESSTVGISPNYDARDEIKRFLNKIEDILEKKYNESNESRQRLTHRN